VTDGGEGDGDAGCDPSCAGTCALGRCIVTLATSQGHPVAMALDDTSVYWTALGSGCPASDGTVVRAPKDGSSAPVVLASGLASPQGIAVDGANVYWAEQGCAGAGSDGGAIGRIAMVPQAGGAVTALATGVGSPTSVALAGGAVYWNDVAGTIDMVAVTGGTPTAVVRKQTNPGALAAAGGYLFWADQVVSAAGGVYAAALPVAPGTTSGVSVGAAGADPVTVVANDAGISWIATQGSGFTASHVSSIGAPSAYYPNVDIDPPALAADDVNLYFIDPDGNGGTLASIPAAGGDVTQLADTVLHGLALAVDDTSVYWIEANGTTVMKATPK
jgi:hypothetical protein